MSGEKFRHVFLKSDGFKRDATRFDAWEAVDELKTLLDVHRTLGDVIPGSGGLRKIRIALPGRGKSGGARIIYYQIVDDCVLFLTIYAKSERDNLTASELLKAIALRQ